MNVKQVKQLLDKKIKSEIIQCLYYYKIKHIETSLLHFEKAISLGGFYEDITNQKVSCIQCLQKAFRSQTEFNNYYNVFLRGNKNAEAE